MVIDRSVIKVRPPLPNARRKKAAQAEDLSGP